MNEEPLVTVNILSYNRKDELRHTLKKVYEQDYKNIEVIVVDNASSDGTPEMVEEEFPYVNLIKLDENIGIAGWNKGFEAAKGEYVLVLDDDSYPSNECIQNSVSCIQSNHRIGVVALPVYNNYFQSFQSMYIDKNQPNSFIGCGALIRNSIFNEVGMFSELLFIYGHEIEYSMRVYNSEFKIVYCNDALITHNNAMNNRILKRGTDLRRKFYTSRNYILILLQHFSYKYLAFFIPQLVFSRAFMALIDHSFCKTTMGFLSAVKYLPKILQTRQPLNKEIQLFYKKGNFMGRFVSEIHY